MKILGIETSCDETAAAIVENGTKILGSIVATSAEMHAKTGGVIPEQAARQQVISVLPVVKTAFKEAGLNKGDVDLVAVTVGPGLIGSLLVGIETARTLSLLWKKPVVAVNHLVAHVYANWLSHQPPKFPALALVVSGGHTDLVLMKSHGNLEWIGGTRDDAAGEAFDKCARLLGLPYPGGPAISRAALEYKNTNGRDLFPRPMFGDDNFDWSFSGLKTAVLRAVAKQKSLDVPRLSAEIQEAIVDVLVEKTLRAVAKFKPRSLLLAGGVAANQRLREKFQEEIAGRKLKIDFFVPPPPLCTDNATYIASFAYFVNSPTEWQKLKANPELTIVGQI